MHPPRGYLAPSSHNSSVLWAEVLAAWRVQDVEQCLLPKCLRSHQQWALLTSAARQAGSTESHCLLPEELGHPRDKGTGWTPWEGAVG